MCTWILSLALTAAAAEPPVKVAVLPMVMLAEAPAPRYDGYVTAAVPAWRAELRRERSHEVATVPKELARALPGAVHANLGASWDGAFRSDAFPVGRQRALSHALRTQNDERVERNLSAIARHRDADYTLVMWTQTLQSAPLTAEAFPGALVHTETGPVFVDLIQEQHRVNALVGVAVIDRSGAVQCSAVLPTEGLISMRDSPRMAARLMAISLAARLNGAGLREPLRVAAR